MSKLQISNTSQLSLATAENQWLRERTLALIEINAQQEEQIKSLQERIDAFNEEAKIIESE